MGLMTMTDTTKSVPPVILPPSAGLPPLKALPSLGEPAPSEPPAFDADAIRAMVREEADKLVGERLKAIEAGELTKAGARPEEDQQFANFDKKLEVYGVDLAEALPGFVLRWINDDRDRIPRSQVQGWTFVTKQEAGLNDKLTPINKDMGENIAVYVGGDEQGKAMRAFLMKIPKEGFDRIMAPKERRDDMIEEAIRRGGIGPALSQGGYPGAERVPIKYQIPPPQAQIGTRRK